jgi:hypothetical protein
MIHHTILANRGISPESTRPPRARERQPCNRGRTRPTRPRIINRLPRINCNRRCVTHPCGPEESRGPVHGNNQPVWSCKIRKTPLLVLPASPNPEISITYKNKIKLTVPAHSSFSPHHAHKVSRYGLWFAKTSWYRPWKNPHAASSPHAGGVQSPQSVLVHLGESLHLVVTLSPSVPQDKLREGSLVAREMLRCAQHDKLGKNFRRSVLVEIKNLF